MSILPSLEKAQTDRFAQMLSVKSFHDVINLAFQSGFTTCADVTARMHDELAVTLHNEMGGKKST